MQKNKIAKLLLTVSLFYMVLNQTTHMSKEVQDDSIDNEIIEEPIKQDTEDIIIEDEIIEEEIIDVTESLEDNTDSSDIMNETLIEDVKDEALIEVRSSIVKSGENGNTTWTIDDEGELLISPKPATNGQLNTTPGTRSAFHVDNSIITSIVLESGVQLPNNAVNLFKDLSNVISIDFQNTDTSNVSAMPSLFEGMTSLTHVNVEQLNVSNTSNFNSMFRGVSSLSSLDINSWNTQSATAMQSMFKGMTSLTNLNIKDWNVEKVSIMTSMFEGLSSLQSLDISIWNTMNATRMDSMFSGMSQLTSLDLNNWNVEKVSDMTHMFSLTPQLKTLNIKDWSTKNVTSMSSMFSGSVSLTELDLKEWDTSKVKTMIHMFKNTTSLESIELSDWNVQAVTNMAYMFENATSLKSIDLSRWKVDELLNANSMFNNTTSLTDLNIKEWELKKVNNVGYMFANMSSLESLNLESWNIVDNATLSTRYVFQNTTLKELTLGSKTVFRHNPELPEIVSNDQFTGRWILSSDYETVYDSSLSFLTDYDGSKPGTYVWQEKYEVEYLIDNETTHTNPAYYEQGVGIANLSDAIKDGHTFKGWFDSNNNLVTSISPDSTGKITLKASFKGEVYDIEYILDGGVNHKDNPSTYEYGIGVPKLFEPTKEGFTFDGWFNTQREPITSIDEDVEDLIILTAKWTKLDTPVEEVEEPTKDEGTKPPTGLKNLSTLNTIILFLSLIVLYLNISKKRRYNK